MKKTATILALAGLSMASNSEHLHGSFRNRKIVDHKPLVTLNPETLPADDELQILRIDGFHPSSNNYDPRVKNSPTKPKGYTIPTNPKVWNPPKRDVVLYNDDEFGIARMNDDAADDELQILRVDGFHPSSSNYDPRVKNTPTKPKGYTIPTNPKIWNPPKRDVVLYNDDEFGIARMNDDADDDELQILRMDGFHPSSSNYDPRVKNTPAKPKGYTIPTNPKVWNPPKRDVVLYNDDELQILRMDGFTSSSSNYDPRVKSSPTKPKGYTIPTNPKVWNPPKKDFVLYNDDADNELVTLGELLDDKARIAHRYGL